MKKLFFFQFFVEARDLRLVNQKIVTANVQVDVDVDDAPVFTSSTVVPSLDETASQGQSVHTLSAFDSDRAVSTGLCERMSSTWCENSTVRATFFSKHYQRFSKIDLLLSIHCS